MLELSLNHYLAVSAVLFALGAFGIFLNRLVVPLQVLDLCSQQSVCLSHHSKLFL